MTTLNQPAKLFRLPYSQEFYVCTCEAKTKDACTCDRNTLITTHANPYLADPVLVDWLLLQSEPFSISQAIEALGLAEMAARSKDHALHVSIDTHLALQKCHCTRLDSGLFIAPSCETLTGLDLRRPARNQSQPEAQPPSQVLPAHHLEPSPASDEDHQSAAADQATDPQLPQQ